MGGRRQLQKGLSWGVVGVCRGPSPEGVPPPPWKVQGVEGLDLVRSSKSARRGLSVVKGESEETRVAVVVSDPIWTCLTSERGE